MNVENIKKINEMSKILRSHGIAQDSQEGTRLAEQMGAKAVPSGGESFDKDKVELLLERQARKFQQQIEMLSEKLLRLEERVNSLPKQRPIEVREVHSAPDPSPNDSALSPSSSGGNAKKPAQKDESRTGQFTSDDVSVEKMFYFGRK